MSTRFRALTGAFIGDEGESTVKTSVAAKGNGSGIKTDSTVKDDQIHDTLIDKDTIAMGSQIERTAAVQKGIVVDASSTRDLKSFLVNASGRHVCRCGSHSQCQSY